MELKTQQLITGTLGLSFITGLIFGITMNKPDKIESIVIIIVSMIIVIISIFLISSGYEEEES